MTRPTSRDLDRVELALSQATAALDDLERSLWPQTQDEAPAWLLEARQGAVRLSSALEDATANLYPAEDFIVNTEVRRWVCDHCGAPLVTPLADAEEENGLVFTCTCHDVGSNRRPRIRKALA